MNEYKLCGQIIKNVDIKATNKNNKILNRIKQLSESYRIEIITDDDIYEDFIVDPEKMCIIEDGKKINFYDTLDDDDNALILKDSDKQLKNFKFKIDKSGYYNIPVSYRVLFEIDYIDPNEFWDDPYSY